MELAICRSFSFAYSLFASLKMSGPSVTYSGYWHPPLPDIIPPQSQTQNLHIVPIHPTKVLPSQNFKEFKVLSAKESGVSSLKKEWEKRKEVPSSIPKRVAKYGVQIERPNSIQGWVHFLPLHRTFILPKIKICLSTNPSRIPFRLGNTGNQGMQKTSCP